MRAVAEDDGLPEETVFQELAPAKINLTLTVLGRRSDGYHELESLVAFTNIGDVVELDLAQPPGVVTTGPFGAAIAGTNLMDVALTRLAQVEPRLRLGAVTLTKNLPVAAGVGGGSADAAALLRAVRRANPGLADAVDWPAVALSLGADVPVCFACRPAWMTGVGERLDFLAGPLPAFHIVLANPLVPVPADKTARVFRELAAGPLENTGGRSRPDRFDDLAALLETMRERGNDLSEPAERVVPQIGLVLAALRGLPGVAYAGLSGAGPTCFGVFEQASAAEHAASSLATARPGWWVAAAAVDPRGLSAPG